MSFSLIEDLSAEVTVSGMLKTLLRLLLSHYTCLDFPPE